MIYHFLGGPRPLFDRYAICEQYRHDLANAQHVWTHEHVFRRSAIYIYVNQVCLPELMKIELQHSHRLVDCQLFARDLERTRLFLRRVVGLEQEARWQGGIANPLVRKQLLGVGKQHQLFGLSPWMSSYLGYVIASSALHVLADSQIAEAVANSYMSYMNQAWKLMGVPQQDLALSIERGESSFCAWDGIEDSLQVIIQTYVSLFGEAETMAIWDQVSRVVHFTVANIMTQALDH